MTCPEGRKPTRRTRRRKRTPGARRTSTERRLPGKPVQREEAKREKDHKNARCRLDRGEAMKICARPRSSRRGDPPVADRSIDHRRSFLFELVGTGAAGRAFTSGAWPLRRRHAFAAGVSLATFVGSQSAPGARARRRSPPPATPPRAAGTGGAAARLRSRRPWRRRPASQPPSPGSDRPRSLCASQPTPSRHRARRRCSVLTSPSGSEPLRPICEPAFTGRPAARSSSSLAKFSGVRSS